MATEIEIDDSLYSRQRYVLGDGAMKRMAQSSVLVYGLGGLGVEIAKNIVLAGVKSLTIQDCKVAGTIDLGSQFFLREEDVQCKRNRAEASTSRIAELNPYVNIKALTTPLDDTIDLSYLTSFQCVILTEASLSTQLRVNQFCRCQNPQIQFISADVFGVFCGAFCDFGDQFQVSDVNGEEPKSVFVDKITQENPGKVSCLDNRFHGFEDGDTIMFKEVKGMTALNDRQCNINVINPFTFSICNTTGDEFNPHEGGGIATQVKIQQTVSFKSLESELQSPTLLTPDLSKLQAPSNIHLGFLALHKFREKNQRLPNVWCQTDAAQVVSLSQEINNQMSSRVEEVDESLLKYLSYTCQGCLAPLCAAIGGLVAQEGLKALTGKFMPLNQWLYFDASEVISQFDYPEDDIFSMRGDRLDALRICVGDHVCKKLADLKLFMVGCGAIGCELLKIYALLGVGSGPNGMLTITDNDLIEKSNLNRQFLFRPHHIRKPKSTTAAQSVLEINPALKIQPQQNKVCPQTEEKIYNDAFFEQQDMIVNALDNVEARRYVDSRIVTNRKPLLESGTMGTKGHVQVIVPDITESYTSQNDPQDTGVPFCTLKSFPQSVEHCIQWARDKFESSFALKPNHFNKFWTSNGSPEEILHKLSDNIMLEGVVQCSKMLKFRPRTWEECLVIGRLKFEKYFNHRAKQLVHSFPLDTLLSDGTLFWQSPKRPPVPIEFDINNPIHTGFVLSTARLFADICMVQWTQKDLSMERLCEILPSIHVPEFVPANKRIVVDESVTKEEASDAPAEDEMSESAERIKVTVSHSSSQILPMVPLEFEKDDDANGHIDYITAASNLRAMMYKIDCVDRLKVKRIAGRIVPAIATTTAAVAGLVSIELLKVIEKMPVEKIKNTFLNLALPVMLFSEPGPAEKFVIREGLSFTMWDKWEVYGNAKFTLKQFLDHFQETYKMEASMVVHGVRMIYVPVMPGHTKRLPHTMVKLLKPGPTTKYVDLIVSFEGGDEEDIPGPPVRYHFGL